MNEYTSFGMIPLGLGLFYDLLDEDVMGSSTPFKQFVVEFFPKQTLFGKRFVIKCHWNRQSNNYWKQTIAVFPLQKKIITLSIN